MMTETQTAEVVETEQPTEGFRKGDRVRLSEAGRAARPGSDPDRLGTVLYAHADNPSGYGVRWDGNVAPIYHKPHYLQFVERPAPVPEAELVADQSRHTFTAGDQTITVTGNDLIVVASDPQELVAGQVAMIGQMGEKLAEAEREVEAATALVAACEGANIAPASAKTMLRRATSRVVMLSKIKEALEAGYVMVPNFDGSAVAIRVKRGPKAGTTETTYKNSANVSEERPEILPTGEGDYVDPLPTQYTDSITKKDSAGRDVTVYQAWPAAWKDQIGLPVEFLKPVVVKRTGEAMERMIFDEIVVSPGRRPRGDPLVIGRIYDPRTTKYDRRFHSFLIAWFVDSASI